MSYIKCIDEIVENNVVVHEECVVNCSSLAAWVHFQRNGYDIQNYFGIFSLEAYSPRWIRHIWPTVKYPANFTEYDLIVEEEIDNVWPNRHDTN